MLAPGFMNSVCSDFDLNVPKTDQEPWRGGKNQHPEDKPFEISGPINPFLLPE